MTSRIFSVSNMTAEQMLFTEKDLEKSMDKIETIHFHEVSYEYQVRRFIRTQSNFLLSLFVYVLGERGEWY